jgi:dolichol-phosphate mannosyltransferase
MFYKTKDELRRTLRDGLWALLAGPESTRFIRFALVGLSGIAVNSAVLALFTEQLQWHYMLSVPLATVSSTLWNFLLTEWLVFPDRRKQRWFWRLGLFFALNGAALALRGPIIFGLTSGLGVHYLISNLISIAVATILRFVFADLVIWGRRTPDVYRYSIHGLVTIVSDSVLPELESFRTPLDIAAPTIRVRLRWSVFESSLPATGRRVDYDEIGVLGFRARIDWGEQEIVVTTSPLLRFSPHVLYTNLIEPVLRWVVVDKGYALVHGACLAVKGKAYLITARTDTGKTTTLLQIMSQPHAWVSEAGFIDDDLALISPSGQVFNYPKPLTISAHTLQAVNPSSLPWRERVFLPLQSRIHSREGRRLAHWLTRLVLPMATINAWVQFLVPPPKYLINELLPWVRLTPQAQLAGLFVIERAADGEQVLTSSEALDILMQNCEDAYGFPPYRAIEGVLRRSPRGDLQAVERQIVAAALNNVPATLIRREHGQWWRRIIELVPAPPSLIREAYCLAAGR